jgi:hypothetical protein
MRMSWWNNASSRKMKPLILLSNVRQWTYQTLYQYDDCVKRILRLCSWLGGAQQSCSFYKIHTKQYY